MAEQQRISAREAARIAAAYFRKVTESRPTGIAVEEVELSENGADWLITLGFIGEDFTTRLYKVFRIDAVTGDVRSMKIRTP